MPYYIWVPESVISDVFCWDHRGISGILTSYSPHQADPIRNDQSLICPSVYTKVERKKKNNFGYLFIWMIIDHLSVHLISCCKQPVKCTVNFSDLQGHPPPKFPLYKFNFFQSTKITIFSNRYLIIFTDVI